jgi:monovalent cation/hydrogen antiporter
MESLHQIETIILLLAAVLALTTAAHKLLIPYPILLVIGGLILGLIPGLPTIHLNPDLVFLVFLPPILWAAAYFTSLREFRNNIRPISMLAVGLVLATTATVAAVAHAALPGMGWAEAIALGAIVSPPDAVSATAIAKRLRIPHRLVTILEGESLVNDATALVLYRAAVAAAASGTFILRDTLFQFVLAGVSGVLVGLAVGATARLVLRRLTTDSFTEIAVTLLAPYVAWVLAEQAHSSAVLACVAGGLYLRQHFSAEVAPITRIQGRAVWELLVFVLNGVIFILIGLQLGTLREAVPAGQFASLVFTGVLISATVIVVRLLWVPLGAILPRLVSPSLRRRDPMPPWSHLLIVGWTGMRGIVTLAAALALPVTTAAGTPFPFRAEIILLSFSVILATLVLQGLSAAPLIRALKLEEDRSLEHEEMGARGHAARAALAHLEKLADEDHAIPDHLDQMRTHYERRLQRYAPTGPVDPECTSERAEAFRRIRHETLTAERLALIKLRNDGTISDEVLHRLEHELDVEALRLGIGEQRATALPLERAGAP